MIHRTHRALAVAFVAILALTVFVATGSATNVQPHPWLSHGIAANVHPDPWLTAGFSDGDSAYDVRSTAPDQDVRSHSPKQDVRSHSPKVDVRSHTGRASY